MSLVNKINKEVSNFGLGLLNGSIQGVYAPFLTYSFFSELEDYSYNTPDSLLEGWGRFLGIASSIALTQCPLLSYAIQNKMMMEYSLFLVAMNTADFLISSYKPGHNKL